MEIGNVTSNNYSSQLNNRIKDSTVKTEHDWYPISKQREFQGNQQKKEMEGDVRKEKLGEVVDSMNHFLTPSHTSLRFKLHEDLQEYYVTIIDEQTNEVIREIPPKKMLDLYAAMRDFIGIIFDEKI